MNENDTRPLMVSIWCITYNHEPYIRQCLEGFVMQKTNFRFEAIVHDDASTDGTAAIVREYAEKYPDIIKPIFETENQYSKHDGSLDRIMMESCTGKYIALCEGDDYWTDPLKLQTQVDVMEKNQDIMIAFNKVKTINRDGEILSGTIPYRNNLKEGIITLEIFLNEEFSNLHWTFQTSSFLVRRIVMEKDIAKWYEFLSHFHVGDMPLILWSLLQGTGYYVDTIGGCYRVFSGGLTTQRMQNIQRGIESRLSWINSCEYFDQLTGFKYHKHLRRRILYAEFEIYRMQSKYQSMLKFKYWWIYVKKPQTLVLTLSGLISPNFYKFLKKWRMKQLRINLK